MSTRRYAENTEVSVERSKAEIEGTLMRYGATHFASGWEPGCAYLGFQINDRCVKFLLPLPDINGDDFQQRKVRSRTVECSPEEAAKRWEQACRQRWRALALCIKAKLEAVQAGITTFENEFMAHIVLPDGNTVGDFMQPQIQQAYSTGVMPTRLLLGPGKGKP